MDNDTVLYYIRHEKGTTDRRLAPENYAKK